MDLRKPFQEPPGRGQIPDLQEGRGIFLDPGQCQIGNRAFGQAVEIIPCWTGITHQKQLEQKLEILSGPQGKISVWKGSSEILKALAPTLLPQAWDRLQACLTSALRGETNAGVPLQLQRQDGGFLSAVLTEGPVQEIKGEFYGAVGVIIELRHQLKRLH